MLAFEEQAVKDGFCFVIGIDEAGRGPLAGPVVAAAVLLKTTSFDNRITDSKKMTERQRQKAFIEIFDRGYVGIGIMNEAVIDSVNILQATFLAMRNAAVQLINQLPLDIRCDNNFNRQVLLLIDGPHFKSDLPYLNQPIVDGDAKSLSIACASIVAKVYRDRILTKYHCIYPQYGFHSHKGYPTSAHRQAIERNGLSPIHRRSFHVKSVV